MKRLGVKKKRDQVRIPFRPKGSLGEKGCGGVFSKLCIAYKHTPAFAHGPSRPLSRGDQIKTEVAQQIPLCRLLCFANSRYRQSR